MKIAWLVVVGACGGGATSSADGNVDGHAAVFATVVAQALPMPAYPMGGYLVQFSSADDGCDVLHDLHPTGVTMMELYTLDPQLGTHAFEYGPTAPGGPGQGWFHVYDDDGTDVVDVDAGVDDFASVGMIDLTTVPDPVEGTYDLTFPKGHLSGSFSAPLCPR